MCSIDAHEKQHLSSDNDGSSGGGNALPSNLTTEAIVLLCATIYFIDCYLKCFDLNFLECINMYIETMKGLFQKVPVQLPKPQIIREYSNQYYMILELNGAKIN